MNFTPVSSHRSSGVKWGTPIKVLTLEAPEEEKGVKMKLTQKQIEIVHALVVAKLAFYKLRKIESQVKALEDIEKLLTTTWNEKE